MGLRPKDDGSGRDDGSSRRLDALEERVAALEATLESVTGDTGGRRRLGRSLRGGTSLEARLSELEDELQESRRLSMRVAELTDIVQELLLPVAQQDRELLRERLERYSGSL